MFPIYRDSAGLVPERAGSRISIPKHTAELWVISGCAVLLHLEYSSRNGSPPFNEVTFSYVTALFGEIQIDMP